jgi:hypothetical protein
MAKPNLSNIPGELLNQVSSQPSTISHANSSIQIFGYLDPVSSACVGITHRRLYAVHYSLHPKLPLYLYGLRRTNQLGHYFPLYMMLHFWMDGSGRRYCWCRKKFVDKDLVEDWTSCSCQAWSATLEGKYWGYPVVAVLRKDLSKGTQREEGAGAVNRLLGRLRPKKFLGPLRAARKKGKEGRR